MMNIRRKKNLNRRIFIKKISGLTAGAFLFFPFVTGKVKAHTISNPVKAPFKPEPSSWKDDEINVSWIGHATMLINFYGTIIITDPVLYERIGVYMFGLTIGPARYTEPALSIDEIPQPDIVLLSHAHMDHMDYRTLQSLTELYPNQIDCITAYNTGDVIENFSWKSLQELDWTDKAKLQNIDFTALEVKHFGWRYPWEKDRSRGYMKDGRSYNAYLIEKNGKKILFGGDTAYTLKFKQQNITDVDIALMPVGAYNPWRHNHCNPEEALIMATEHMNAKNFVPMHCKTFRQGMEPTSEPLSWVDNSKNNFNINVGISSIGETLKLRI